MTTPWNKEDQDGTLKGVLMAYLVLILQVALIAALGILVIFFRGVVNYMLWIVLGGVLVTTVLTVLFFRRMRREGKNLREVLNSPVFGGRSVEVSLLGGLASMRIGKPDPHVALDTDIRNHHYQLEDPATQRVRELSELARLLEKDLITQEEYDLAKRQLLNSASTTQDAH